jgi:RNA polymerase sigma-70 factor (ECF subfamily)
VVSVGKIPPHEAQELETCFRAHASYLFGRACVLTCGDLALAHDLVQAAFEAAAMSWPTLKGRPDEQQRKVQVDPLEQAFSSIMLERCWQVIRSLPERQHAVAMLRWGLDMKQNEIATALNMAEKTVSVHLSRVRHKLLKQFGADYPFDGGSPEGASS